MERGCAKIAVRVKDEAHMLALEKAANEQGMLTYIVCDAGHTQVAPNSLTVLAILAPSGDDRKVPLTKDLKLL